MTAAVAEALATALLASKSERRRALLRRAGDGPAVVSALKARADGLLRADARAALRIALVARAAGRATGDGLAVATGKHALAKAFHALLRYPQAADLYAEVAADYARLGLVRERAAVGLARTGALFHLARYAEAEVEARRAVRLYRRAGDAAGEAKVLVNLANVRHAQDRHREAIRLLERARPALVAAGDAVNAAILDYNRANSHSILAHFDRSGPLYASSRRVCAGVGLDVIVARIDYNRAYDLFLQGRLSEARALLATAREAFRRAGAGPALALAARDEAEMALAVGQTGRAAAAAEEARASFVATGAPVEAARATLLGAEAARMRGDEAGAHLLLAEARREFARAGHGGGKALCDLALAASAAAGTQADVRLALQAARVFDRLGMMGKEATALVVAGGLQNDRGSEAAGRRCLGRALSIARRRGLPEVELRAEHALGLAERGAGRGRRALARFRNAIGAYERLRAGMRTDEDRLAFASEKTVVFEDAVRTALDLGRPAEAFELVERARARALVDLLAADSRFTDAALQAGGRLARRLARLKRDLARLDAQAHGRERRDAALPAAVTEALRRALAEREAALNALAASEPETSYALAGRPVVPLDAVRARLGSDRALVTYFAEGSSLGALVVTDHDVRAWRGLATMTEVDRALSAFRFALGSVRSDAARAEAHERALAGAATAPLEDLYRRLVEPLRASLGDRALVVVPHASVHHVPFHALGRGGRLLLDEREVSVAPSATVLAAALARKAAAGTALVVAYADANAPAIAIEAASVARALGARLIEGPAATAGALRRAAAGARVVHVAAHGSYEPADPMLSGLRLADGRLTVPEIASLPLAGALVTLSACESGTGSPQGDEVLGLVRSFLHAGARSLVASLWAVPDASTARLMDGYYAGLTSNQGAAAALRRAMLELRAQHPHPYHWAPFLVVGSWEGLT